MLNHQRLKMRLQQMKAEPVAKNITPVRDQLHSLGVKSQGCSQKKEHITDAQLAEKLNATMLADGLLEIRTVVKANAKYGESIFGQYVDDKIKLFPNSPHSHKDCCYIDTETNGLGSAVGTLAFLVGVGYWENEQFVVEQLLLTGYRGEAAMLQRLQAVISRFPICVSYNGRSFDLPLLASRYRLLKTSCQWQNTQQQLDLLHWVRRAYSKKWPQCNLQTAEQKIIGLQRQDDFPGSMAPTVWSEWLRAKRTDRMPLLLQHHLLDIQSLAVLGQLLQRDIAKPEQSKVDTARIANFWLKAGLREKAVAYLEKHQQSLAQEGTLLLAWCYRQDKDWLRAVSLWQYLASQGNTQALENLAKYFEHECGSAEIAKTYTERLLKRAPNEGGYLHRYDRLCRKI